LLFTRELQRRLDQVGSPVRALAAHPGYSSTNLQGHTGSRLNGVMLNIGERLVATDAEFGARQKLFAIAQDLPGAADIRPRFGFVGPTQPAARSTRARDSGTAKALWELSEQLTGTRFPL